MGDIGRKKKKIPTHFFPKDGNAEQNRRKAGGKEFWDPCSCRKRNCWAVGRGTEHSPARPQEFPSPGPAAGKIEWLAGRACGGSAKGHSAVRRRNANPVRNQVWALRTGI